MQLKSRIDGRRDMGQMTSGKSKKQQQVKEEFHKEEEAGDDDEEEQDQDGLSVHSPCKINPSSLRKETSEVEMELALLESLEIYPPAKLRGPHRHFVIYGMTEYMQRSFNHPFTAEEILKLLGRFYNIEMLKPDDEDSEFLKQEEEFRLPQSYFPDNED